MKTSICLVLTLIAITSPLPAAEKVSVLFLTGITDLPYHDWRQTAPYLQGVLERTGLFEVKRLEEVHGVTASTLAPYDVLVLNYNGPRWGGETERAVEEFIRSGKGLIAVHGVSYGPFFGQNLKQRKLEGEPWPAYGKMMGTTWPLDKIGHGARHAFEVKWVDREHPIAKGLPPSFIASDELYHRMEHHPDAHILATAYSAPETRGTGKTEPMVWTVGFGNGRIVHTCLGHDLSAMSQQGFVDLFARGVEWAATGAVTLAPGVRPHPTPVKDAVRVLAITGGHGYPTSFYTLFDDERIAWSHATSQAEAFRPDLKKKFDVLVFHDMYNEIGEEHRAHLKAFVESGGGVVSTHHAIVNYTSWPWWHENVIGGKYFTEAKDGHKASQFLEGTGIVTMPVDGVRHPVIEGVGPIVAHDEAYRDMWFSPGITVLMDTGHPRNDRPVVYLGPNRQFRSVYIQLGHSGETFHHPGYRRLVRNAIFWAAKAEPLKTPAGS